MSKLVKVLECRKCGAELMRKETGNAMNPNGTYAINKEIYAVSERYCSKCTGKIPNNIIMRKNI